MQVKSLVVIKSLNGARHPAITWYPIDDESTVYVVREIIKDWNGTGVYFEEGVMGYNPDNRKEIGLFIEWVREVQAPGEVCIEQIVEESIYAEI